MQLAYTVWTWISDEFNNWSPRSNNFKGDFEQSLRDLKDLKYEAVECFGFLTDHYGNEVDEFKSLMMKYELEFVNLYHYFSNNLSEDIKSAGEYCKFLSAVGAKTMNTQCVMWMDKPYDRPFSKIEVDRYIESCHKIGALCNQYDITLCMHPHANTSIFNEESIKYFVENSDPGLVSLCLDTAHTELAGMHAPDIFDKYGSRIAYVHLKDLDPDKSLNPEWPMKRFRALGQGTIDFKGVMNALKKHNYNGVVCVELDYQRVNNYESAMVSRKYIDAVLGL